MFLVILLFAAPLLANIRAPWQVEPFPSFALLGGDSLLVVSEDLDFDCPALYQDEGNFEKMQKAACKVIASYKIVSKVESVVNLEFVGPSTDGMAANVNGVAADVKSSNIQITRKQAEGYGMYPVCRFCASDDMPLKSGRFKAKMTKGENTVVVRYMQQLSIREISYGYVQDSEWAQGFEYELWPLAEWQLAPDFKMNIRIKTRPAASSPGYSQRTIPGSAAQLILANPRIVRHAYHFQTEIVNRSIEKISKRRQS